MKHIFILLLLFSVLFAQEEITDQETEDNSNNQEITSENAEENNEVTNENDNTIDEDNTQKLIEIVEPFPTIVSSKATCKIKAVSLDQVKSVTGTVSGTDEEIAIVQEDEYYNLTWESSQDGIYTMVIIAEDMNGNKQESSFPVRFDTTPPKISIANAESITQNREVTISAVIEDSVQVNSVRLFSGEEYRADFKMENGQWECTQNLEKEGVQSYYIEAQDALGNKSKSDEIKFIYDTTAPFIKSVEITPQELQIGILRVAISYEDSISGISGNMEPHAYIENGTKYSLEIVEKDSDKCIFEILITEDFAPGEYAIYIENIRDLANNILPKELMGNIRISDKSEGGNWPFFPQNEMRLVTEGEGCLYFEGSNKEEVLSIEDGKVVAITSSSINELGYILIQQLRGEYVWGYYNILPVKNDQLNRHWALGDIIKKGDVVGTLAQNANLQLYLLVQEEDTWQAHKEKPLKYLQPAPPKNMIVTMVKAPQQHKNFPDEMQISDWLLISYVALFILTLFVFILPKKIKN